MNETYEQIRAKINENYNENKMFLEGMSSQTVDEFFNLTVIQHKRELLFKLCETCNQNALSIINKYNSKLNYFNIY